MHRNLFKSILSLGGLALALSAAPALAQDDQFYYDSTYFNGFIFPPGGAGLVGTNTITRLVADDTILSPANANLDVPFVIFAFYNQGATPVNCRTRFRYWTFAADGSPDVNTTGSTSGVITFPSKSIQVYRFSITGGAPFFTTPADAKQWFGVTFDNNSGGSGATAADLNNMSVLLTDRPDFLDSEDKLFLTTNPGSFFGVNQPVGTQINFGGAPYASMFIGYSDQQSGFTTLSGTVDIQGVDLGLADPGYLPLQVNLDFRDPSSTDAKFRYQASVDGTGSYSVAGLPDATATYDIGVKSPFFTLRKVVSASITNSVDNTLANVTLLPGDANNDNSVNFDDFQILADAYFTASGDPQFDARADFSLDTNVNFDDFQLLADNYFLDGDL